MSRFEEGDPVRVREDVQPKHKHDRVRLWAGRFGEVARVDPEDEGYEYLVDLDGAPKEWRWFGEDELEAVNE